MFVLICQDGATRRRAQNKEAKAKSYYSPEFLIIYPRYKYKSSRVHFKHQMSPQIVLPKTENYMRILNFLDHIFYTSIQNRNRKQLTFICDCTYRLVSDPPGNHIVFFHDSAHLLNNVTYLMASCLLVNMLNGYMFKFYK